MGPIAYLKVTIKNQEQDALWLTNSHSTKELIFKAITGTTIRIIMEIIMDHMMNMGIMVNMVAMLNMDFIMDFHNFIKVWFY